MAFAFATALGWILSVAAFGISIGKGPTHRKPQIVRKTLAAVRTESGFTRLSVLALPAGDCIVHEPPRKYLDFRRYKEAFQGDPSTTEDDLTSIEQADDGWYVSPDDHSGLTTFNCATYAIGEAIGLTKSDWLETRPMSWTRGKSPTALVLESYFDLIVTISITDPCWKTLECYPQLQSGDIIAFAGSKGASDYVHLGRIRKNDGRIRVVSKMGRGPIAQGTIYGTALRFEGEIAEIRIFRERTR